MAPTRNSESLNRWPVAGLIPTLALWRSRKGAEGLGRGFTVWEPYSAWTWWRLGLGGLSNQGFRGLGFRLPRLGASSFRALFVGFGLRSGPKYFEAL